MSIRDALLGKPLASSEEAKEQLTVTTGVPVLGLDALASTGYGPEAALTILVPLGVAGLRYYPFIVLAIVVVLTTLYLSYQQTTAAYPNGGGAYIVAKDNLGLRTAVWAAVALLIDYLLNVAVGIAAGVGVVVSAFPVLQPYALTLCLVVLLTLTLVNLRGVRESGLVFVAPVFAFIICVGATIVIGLARAFASGGSPQPVVSPPPFSPGTGNASVWLLLAAFANGCTAMTGIEAVSNGVPLFREPRVKNAHRTLTVIYAVLASFLLAIGYLVPTYHIRAMDERLPGYQTVLSQLTEAVVGRGAFYYLTSAAVFIVLTYSAQTSFTDFPRVCRLLAEDLYLPSFFANRGRRLVFSYGIIILAVLSGSILIGFGGITSALIPLFAVGAFAAFVLSQTGMLVHWVRRNGRAWQQKLSYNALGAVTTSVALVIIILAKFTEGAWVTIVIVPGLALLLTRIRKHYRRIAREIAAPLGFRPRPSEPPLVVVPLESWNRPAEAAMSFGLLLSNDVTALHVCAEGDDPTYLRRLWHERVEEPARGAGRPMPRLEIVESPYRLIDQPILDFIDRVRRIQPDRFVAVVIPELVEPHWYEYVLHNLHARRLREALLRRQDANVVVVDTPWSLRESSGSLARRREGDELIGTTG